MGKIYNYDEEIFKIIPNFSLPSPIHLQRHLLHFHQCERIKPVPTQDLENIKRNRTRKANAVKRKSAIRSTLDSGDMRHSGLQDFLIAGFEAISKDDHHPGK